MASVQTDRQTDGKTNEGESIGLNVSVGRKMFNIATAAQRQLGKVF